MVPSSTVGRMEPDQLLDRLAHGALHNVRFRDAQTLVISLGFRLVRVKGSHHVFVHPKVPELLNLQDVRGEAKPYQLRQLLRLVRGYALELQDGT